MNETLQFLETVLPPEGDHWYVAAIIREGRCNHLWFRKRLELAAALVTADGRQESAYHACSTFKERAGGRKGNNTAAISSLWTDIDAGEGKQYATAASAHDAVVGFCSATGLPRPLCVCSGFGIHAYWPLRDVLDPQTWKILANGLGLLLRRHGIKNERTTDLASLLRPPGTHNRKHATPAPVTIMDQPGDLPYQLDRLERLLDVDPRENIQRAASHINGYSIAARLVAVATHAPRYCRDAIAGCAQLREPYRDTRGYIPEPLWHAGLGVFAYIEGDGDQVAHEWSSDDDRYSEHATQSRLDRLRVSTSGATTCAKFHEINPQTCEACPHWQKIKSPIALCSGAHAQTKGQEVQGLRGDLRGHPNQEQIILPDLPAPYEWNDEYSLCLGHEDKNGEHVSTVISKHPIHLDRVYQREGKASSFAYGFRQFIPSAGWHDITINANTMRSSGGLGDLSEQGANISDFSAFIKYTITAVDMQFTDQLGTLYEQYGWKDQDSTFLYGANLYTASKAVPVVVNKDIQTRTGGKETWVGPCSGGALAEWSAIANKLFAAGTEAQSVCLCASFGAVFHRFLSRDEGGAVVSLVTHGGGKGKTTALAGAMSIWGRKQGLSLENIDTSISRGATLSSIGNIPLFYDEFETCDPAFVRDFIRMFTNGRDKRRLGRDGAVKDPGMPWQTTLFTASNASLIDSITSIGNDVLSTRIWEMSTDVPEHLKYLFQGDRLKDSLRAHSGHAGAAFLSKLLQPGNLATARHELDRWAGIIEQAGRFTTEHRFWIRLAATVAVAAEIVTSGEKLLAFEPRRITQWLVDQMVARLATQGENKDEWAADTLARFVHQHSQNQIVVNGPFIPGQTGATVWIKPTREIYVRREKEGGKVYIDRSALRSWCVKNGINTRELIKKLVDDGVCIDPWRYVTLGAGTDYTSMRVRALMIDGQHEKVGSVFVGEGADVLPFERRREPNSDEDLEIDMPY